MSETRGLHISSENCNCMIVSSLNFICLLSSLLYFTLLYFTLLYFTLLYFTLLYVWWHLKQFFVVPI